MNGREHGREPPPVQSGGQVWAHVGQPFTPAHYDLLIVGAGRMGAALARFLRELAPQLSLLLAEEGGLPNEEGATLLAAGVWHAHVPGGQQQRAEDTRTLLGDLLNVCGLLEFSAEAGAGFSPIAECWTPELLGMVDPEVLPFVRRDGRAGTYSAGTLALNCANAAIQAGADLMLNVRAELCGTTSEGRARVRLHRLSVTNMHEVVIDHSVNVTAGRVIVAAGAAGPHLAEVGLGVVTPHRRAYRQTPRLEVPSTPASRVLQLNIGSGELLLRPRDGGYTVIAPVPHPDPWGYVPTGGRLVGVPVGLRRETLNAVLEVMDGLPALATEALVPGRSIADIPGAWVALPEGGWPLWERLDEAHWLLLGGERADLTGLSVARELAEALAKAETPGA
ncbi:FAD-dependent oxidoreductase [Deinococcus altitudinis]|uniref:FAD-dependent oxidoreductase n=1 Tax=Deinococcus altitudinis TaxID=468914 RepID=UPI0038913E1B